MSSLKITPDEKQNIINKFPENIRHYLYDISNPLDEIEVMISIFKKYNVRIIILDSRDEFGLCDILSYFHLSDIAKAINYDETSITKTIKRWNLDSFDMNYFKKILNGNNDNDDNDDDNYEIKDVLNSFKNNIINYSTINSKAKLL